MARRALLQWAGMVAGREDEHGCSKAGLPDPERAANLQRAWCAAWHGGSGPAAETKFEVLLEAEHRANFDLWHAEDQARDPLANDATIVAVKRQIDRTNQRRNDLVEQIDELLLRCVGKPAGNAPLHSETPGMMLDRLSILALKIFHTEEEIARPEADAAHRRWNRQRLATLEEQHADLLAALAELFVTVGRGERRFKVYRQLKMYNDPALNPAIYTAPGELKR